MKHGMKMGLILLVLGLIVIGINLFMINGGSYFPKLLLIGPCLALLGFGYMIFKGGDIANDVPNNMKSKLHWKNAPVLSKIMWIVFGIGGLGLGFWWMISMGGKI